jgi:hypothetical protein
MGGSTRKSIPLSPAVAEALERIRTSGTDEAEAATELVGIDTTTVSEAQTLAAVVDLGRRLIEERAREESYRRLAAIDAADADRDRERAAFRARRAERERRRASEERAIGEAERGAA